MKKINYKILIITSLVCLSSIILGILFYNQLPEQVAIHFDIENNPNSYISKVVFIFGIPILMTLFQIFACIVNDLQDKNKEANKKATTIFKWIIPIITITMYCITISFALGNSLDIRKIVMILLGIMFIVMGNYLPKTKGNTYVHFSKIKDENILNNVLRKSGYVVILDGILLILSILFNPIVSVLTVILIILETIGLFIYTIIKNRN